MRSGKQNLQAGRRKTPALSVIVLPAILLGFGLPTTSVQGQAAPYKRTNSEYAAVIQHLFLIGPNMSLALAQVERVMPDLPPLGPDLRPDGMPDRFDFRVTEQLVGPRVPTVLTVDNITRAGSRQPRVGSTFVTYNSAQARRGQRWLVVYNPNLSAEKDRIWVGTTLLTGPDDPLLSLARRHAAWLRASDRATTAAKAGAITVSTGEPFLSRFAALCSLAALSVGDRHMPGAVTRKELQRTIARLLEQPGLDKALRLFAMNCVDVGDTSPVEIGSDRALLLRYLLRVIATETDRESLHLAAGKLAGLATRTDAGPPYASYRFPQVIEALEAREQADLAEHPATGSLITLHLGNIRMTYARQGKGQDYPIVERLIP